MSIINIACGNEAKTVVGLRCMCVPLHKEGLSLRDIAAKVGKSPKFVKGAVS
jgi:hypothetical protein